MGSERALWGTVRAKLKPYRAHMERIENMVNSGTPDVNIKIPGCPEFWLELKYLHAWPVRPETIVTIDHFTLDQRAWLLARCRAGGLALVLLQVEREYLLYHGTTAAELLGRETKAVLQREAQVRMVKIFDPSAVVSYVKSTT